MNVMTEQKIIKNKVGLLKLAEQLGSVSQACKVSGSSASRSERKVCGIERVGAGIMPGLTGQNPDYRGMKIVTGHWGNR